MRQPRTLTTASLVSVGLNTVHLAQDAVHAAEGMPRSAVPVILVVMVTMLLGTFELAGRRSGYIIMLLGGLFATWMPVLHGLGPQATRWGVFFVSTLLALGVAGAYTAVLAAAALWRSFRSREPRRS